MFLRAVAIPDDPIETLSILSPDFDDNACSHGQSMNQITASGIFRMRHSTSSHRFSDIVLLSVTLMRTALIDLQDRRVRA